VLIWCIGVGTREYLYFYYYLPYLYKCSHWCPVSLVFISSSVTYSTVCTVLMSQSIYVVGLHQLQMPSLPKFLVFVNPFSGPGRALQIFQQSIVPVFAEAGLQYHLIVTGYRACGFLWLLHWTMLDPALTLTITYVRPALAHTRCRPTAQTKPPKSYPSFFAALHGSVRVRTHLMSQIGSGLRVSASLKKKSLPGSVLWQPKGGCDLEGFICGSLTSYQSSAVIVQSSVWRFLSS